MKNKKYMKIICTAMILVVLTSLFACDGFGTTDAPREKIFFDFFDTVTYIYDYSGGSDDDFDTNCAEAESVLREYHRLFDIYNEYSGMNNLCTVNKNAGGDAVKVDGKLIEFLLYAKELHAKTDGEMNVMMGAVLRLWHDARSDAESASSNLNIPTSAVLEEAARHISIDLLEIDAEAGTVRISDKNASIDVGAVGKGYAAEKAGEILRKNGAHGYVLDVGGNLKIIGTKPDGSGWKTGIRDPENTQNYAHYLTLANTSCVTSGDYERYFTIDGQKYHHIIDKDTLMPSGHFSSVTVITPDSGLADALSTALFCMSYEDGTELLKNFENVDVIWITRDGQKYLTDRLK
ncbi:MAG: FAD:protein FMN transferase [Eubacteriales bacterium]